MGGRPESPHVDDTASTTPPDIDDALDGDPPASVEARGPHLPARWPVLVFVGLAIVATWATYPSPPAWSPDTVVAYLLDLLPTVCAVLLPGALLLRHPDAPRRARPLLFGTLLLATVPFLRLAAPQLQGFFMSLTPPPPEQDWFVPSSIVFGFFNGLVGLFGALYIALGLSQTRHWAYRGSARIAGFAVLAVGLIASVATVYSISRADLSTIDMTLPLWAYLVGSIALSVATIMTWSYLAMSLVRSTLSGEEPVLAWSAGAVGACLLLATYTIGAWANLVQTSNETITTLIFWVSNTSYSLGFLLLLVAFLLGMPSLEPIDWAEDDGDLDDAEDGTLETDGTHAVVETEAAEPEGERPVWRDPNQEPG